MNREPTMPRSLSRRSMHVVRRLHMYLGLLLLPWALLYGVTAFLFNHPTAFSDQPTATFYPSDLQETPLASVPTPNEQADAVLTLVNARLQPATPYQRAGEASYTREFAFANVKSEGRTINVLVDVQHGGGTVREANPEPVKKAPPPAQFAIGAAPAPKGNAPRPSGPVSDGLHLSPSVPDRIRDSIPTIMERTGFPSGTATVTSVPEVRFPIVVDGVTWTATYNPMTGSLSGQPADATETPELGWRKFVLRLHTAHGYPGTTNARWYWALLVDVMAFVMVFWGGSGLLMWWQLKASRWVGFALLFVSTTFATLIALAMYAAIRG